METERRSLTKTILVFLGCAVLVAAAGCSEQKAEPENKATAKATASADQSKAAEPPAEPPIGKWQVTKAEGRYADQNVGIVWSFSANGKAFSLAQSDSSVTGRSEQQSVQGSEKKVPWRWKRVDPQTIDLIYAGSGEAASVRHRMEGELLVLDWNNGGQILYLRRTK